MSVDGAVCPRCGERNVGRWPKCWVCRERLPTAPPAPPAHWTLGRVAWVAFKTVAILVALVIVLVVGAIALFLITCFSGGGFNVR